MCPRAKLALSIKQSLLISRSDPCCSIAGQIPSEPGDLYGSNELIAHLIRSGDITFLAACQFALEALLGASSGPLKRQATGDSFIVLEPGK